MNWGEFFNMGGYAVYVWTSWGVTLFVLLWQFILPKRTNAKIKQEIRRQLKRDEKLKNTQSRTSNS